MLSKNHFQKLIISNHFRHIYINNNFIFFKDLFNQISIQDATCDYANPKGIFMNHEFLWMRQQPYCVLLVCEISHIAALCTFLK